MLKIILDDGVYQKRRQWKREVKKGLLQKIKKPLNSAVFGIIVYGGDRGTRTPGLLNAIQTRSQLRHAPVTTTTI